MSLHILYRVVCEALLNEFQVWFSTTGDRDDFMALLGKFVQQILGNASNSRNGDFYGEFGLRNSKVM